MSLISETFHKEKLKKYNVNIKTKFIVGSKILEKNSNDNVNNDIKQGIICQKEYFINNKLSHTENNFDTRIEYTYISNNEVNKEYK